MIGGGHAATAAGDKVGMVLGLRGLGLGGQMLLTGNLALSCVRSVMSFVRSLISSIKARVRARGRAHGCCCL
jgi:hypothetical protein